MTYKSIEFDISSRTLIEGHRLVKNPPILKDIRIAWYRDIYYFHRTAVFYILLMKIYHIHSNTLQGLVMFAPRMPPGVNNSRHK